MIKSAFIIGAFAFLLSACSSGVVTTSSHYLLVSSQDVTQGYQENNRIKVNVNLPEYLKTPYFVMLNDSHQVHYARNHKWAEPLDMGIERAIHLSWHQLVGDDIQQANKQSEVTVDIDFFHVTENGVVEFIGKLVVDGRDYRFNLQRRLSADGYQEAVKQMSLIIKDMLKSI